MDRCRCADYKAAVEKLRFYTVGTLRPDIIDNYDRSQFVTAWVKHGVDYEDMKFSKPKAARRITPAEWKEMQLKPELRKIEQMWCPYMTPILK
ncbi:jg15230 [Pararge aegeria aegeria]|uniref:Jg15230 protein n=1 Tax=Pararge aegeria aegeria TaxID=348720 RepID=A0A8S4RGI8_9NEOP|nr:jg15230 [Pararge aegeria aegeria]